VDIKNPKYIIHNTVYTLVLSLVAFFLPLTLYLVTLAPTYIPIDSAEFALCMNFWGLCHPPGFPLYILLGKIFTGIFPLGSLIYKANLFSAIFGALTVLLAFATLVELKVKKEIAFLVALFLAVNQILWEFSIASDVFTFGAFLTLAVFYLAFKKRQYLAFFVLGLSASHFYITATLWPLLAWYFWRADTTNTTNTTYMSYKTLGFLLAAAVFFALGFFPQAVMFWRMQQGPEINWGHAKGFAGFVDYLRRREFGSIFLISNPVLTFSIIKLFRQFWVFFISFFANFAVVLPLIGIGGLVLSKAWEDRRIILLFGAFVILTCIQLTLLSTIDPLEAGNPFQLNKFYLQSFVIWMVLAGYALNFFAEKLFDGETTYINILTGFLIVVYFFANWHTNNYSKNYFSQNMVSDAMSQLPQGSVAITLSHVFYFGGLYEQKIDSKYQNVILLYFPNDKNRDGESYYPELFARGVNRDFAGKIEAGKSLGVAERYVLETISRNLDKPIYLLQGGFEEKFFLYLRPYIKPYGLWWKIEPSALSKVDTSMLMNSFSNFKNGEVKSGDLELKQQRDDLLTYAVSYHSAAIYLVSIGDWNKALEFLDRSLVVNNDGGNIKNEIDLIRKTAELDGRFEELMSAKNKDKVEELGNNLFTLQNYERCRQVFEKAVAVFAGDAQTWNNLGACSASLGRVEEAKNAYKKALAIDPGLDLARKGMEALSK